MPSLQSSIVSELDPADVIIVGLNHTTSKEWLINYSVQKSLTFPILYDASGIYDEYQIGFGYGNIMPNWLVVDRYGKIHTRYDGDLGIVAQIKEIIISLIDQ